MSERLTEQIILCAGERVNAECARVIEQFMGEWQSERFEFVMSDWFPDDQIQQVSLLWVVDESEPWATVHSALHHQIPVLMPAGNASMKQVCLSGNCGLYYRNAVEAHMCLDFLFKNEAIRRRLGSNGQGYLMRQAHHGLRPITA